MSCRKSVYSQALMVLGGNTQSRGVLEAAVTPDGQTIIPASFDGTLNVWDLATRECKSTFRGHVGTVVGVAVRPISRVASQLQATGQ